MAKVGKVRKSDSRHHKAAPYRLPSSAQRAPEDIHSKKKCSKAHVKKEWEDATCSVCMEFPHNAVLLLCSSYNKGCRPYMCATSYRYSNCLDQYKKAYTKVTSIESAQHGSMDNSSYNLGLGDPNEKTEVMELLCPLCRGQVKGWTVVDSAREYFNAKKRTCMQDKCSFVGNYKHLRKHVRAEHPSARPRQVDPILEAEWKRLEHERERNDVISTIRSSTPGAIVLGDYVIEGNYRGLYRDFDLDDYLGDAFFPLESLGRNVIRSHQSSQRGYHSLDEEDNDGMYRSAAAGTHPRRLFFGRSRRRRHRDANGGR